MYNIGDFARFGSVSVRMLRHYDQIGLLRPARVDPITNYRSYSAAQLPTLNRIVALKELGFSLDEIRQLIGEITAAQLHGMLALRRSQLQQELAESEAKLRGVEARLRHIEKEGQMPVQEVLTKALPAIRIAAIAQPAPGFGPGNLVPLLQPAFDRLVPAMKAAGVEATGFPFACYSGDATDGSLIVFAAFPVARDVEVVPPDVGLYDLAAVPAAAVLTWRGNLDNAHGEIYQAMPRWIEDNGYEPVGAGRDVFVDLFPADPEQAVMEVQWPLRRPGDSAPEIAPRKVA